MFKKYIKNETGEVMIEGMVVVILTLLMLVWILGVGFLYYQRYTVRIVTNDAASKIANAYSNPTSDLITGYVSRNDVVKKAVYNTSTLNDINSNCSKSYVTYILDNTNFYGTVKDINLSLNHYNDPFGRSHISVTTTCTFNTPFGQALDFFGMSGISEYETTAYADSTDLSSYVSSVTTADVLTNGSIIKTPSIVSSTVNMINSLKGAFDKFSK